MIWVVIAMGVMSIIALTYGVALGIQIENNRIKHLLKPALTEQFRICMEQGFHEGVAYERKQNANSNKPR